MIHLRKRTRILSSILFTRPVFCLFRPSIKCNYDCVMCNVPDYNKKLQPTSLNDLRDMIPRLYKLGVGIVNIGGGEPMLLDNLPDIIALLNTRFSVRLQTNGSHPDPKFIKELVLSGLDGVSVTFNSLNEELQRKITGNENAWISSLESLYWFSKLMPRRGKLMIMNAIVTRNNVLELPGLIQLAAHLGFKAAFIPLLSSNNSQDNHPFHKKVDNLLPDKNQINELFQIYNEIKNSKYRKHLATSKLFLKESIEFHKTRKNAWKCYAGDLFFVINPEGELSICTEYPPIGNLFNDDFYNNFCDFRRKFDLTRLIGSCSGCMHPCFYEISMMKKPSVLMKRMVEEFHSMIHPRPTPKSFEEVYMFAERLKRRYSGS